MTYSEFATREHPSCIMFLLDQSASMAERWGSTRAGAGQNKAEGVALAVNDALDELLGTRCQPSFDGVRYYYDIGIVGYGATVGSVLPGALNDRTLASAPELYEAQRTTDANGQPCGAFWIAPVSQNGTPMADALDLVGNILAGWVTNHPKSFPPLVINITDGIAGPSEVPPLEWSRRIQSLATDDGNVLMFNMHISARSDAAVEYPSDRESLPDEFAKLLFDMSSQLPEYMANYLTNVLHRPRPSAGSRCFLFNASSSTLIEGLQVGTMGGPAPGQDD